MCESLDRDTLYKYAWYLANPKEEKLIFQPGEKEKIEKHIKEYPDCQEVLEEMKKEAEEYIYRNERHETLRRDVIALLTSKDPLKEIKILLDISRYDA